MINNSDGKSLYIDNELVDKMEVITCNTQNDDNSITIGAGYYSIGIANFFKGQLDELRIYGRDINESEILELYSEGDSFKLSEINAAKEAGRQECISNPVSCGIESQYSQSQVDKIVRNILQWGDTNDDGKINLSEAIKALQITAGNEVDP
ncbi:hypothetical protein MHK_007614 [Candidatus Magnetomorum sp. HK-1]|nr:hypothetical protein MHK_007614 [Candidatus Magnetomorum sp. HK-1]